MSTHTNEELEKLFDAQFGELRGGFILSEEEYDKHKKWSIESGVFEYQITSGILKTTASENRHSV
jgi:hypothetical protein